MPELSMRKCLPKLSRKVKGLITHADPESNSRVIFILNLGHPQGPLQITLQPMPA